MTQRTRYFLLGSSLILVACLCTGLVAYYNGGLPLKAAGAGPAELAYMPADAMVVAYADVQGIMNSEFRQKLRQILPSGEEKDRLQNEIGIDLERDVDTVVASVSSGPITGKGAVVVVRGRFNTGMIEATARNHGARVEEYKGKRLVLMADSSAGSTTSGEAPHANVDITTGGVAFLEPGLLALGELTGIKRAIDASESNASVTSNADLMRLVSGMDNRNNAWVVGRFDEMASSTPVPQDLKDRIPPVQWVAVGVHVDGGVSGMIRAEARDDQSGEQLRAVVRGALAAAQLVSGKDARIETMVKSIQVDGTGKTATMSFTVPAEVLDIINGLAGLNNMNKPGKTIQK